MRVGPNTTIAIDYTVRLESGEVVDSTEGGSPLVFHFGREEIIPAVERELTGLGAGDRRDILVPPEEAYGPRRPEAVQRVPLDRFPAHVTPAPGMRLVVRDPDGGELPVTVRGLSESHATLDFNHPLAGERLRFSVQVVEVQPTEDAPGDGPP
ncbi:MAG: peptidylprolyl isomerase [Candidatus Methylomirabilales bacterium]